MLGVFPDSRGDLICDCQQDQLRHQRDRVAWQLVLSRASSLNCRTSSSKTVSMPRLVRPGSTRGNLRAGFQQRMVSAMVDADSLILLG